MCQSLIVCNLFLFNIKRMASKTNAEEDLPPKPSDLDSFLDHFLSNHRDDNFISVKHGNYFVSKNEIVGEVVDWTMQYLQYM